jgi:streptomycin 6-kinase
LKDSRGKKRLRPGHDLTSLCVEGRDREATDIIGDLHHYNVLFDADAGWVIIDPWGALGEIEFEVAAALRNPVAMPALLGDPSVMERRLRTYEEILNFNADRALKWAFATVVLGILWPFHKTVGVDLRPSFAAAARSMLGLLE